MERQEIQSRWTEHFKKQLNREEPTDPITTEDGCEFEPSEIIDEIAVTEPTLGEVKAAIQQFKNGKSPEIDFITAELLKAHKEFSAEEMHELMEKCGNTKGSLINGRKGWLSSYQRKETTRNVRTGVQLLCS